MKLFEEYPYLKNEKVILRKLTEADAPGLERLTSENEVYKTLPSFLFELRYEDKREAIAHMDEEFFDTKESLLLGIFPLDEPGHLIGIAEIYNYEEHKKKASIGVRLDKDYHGQGIATSIAELLKIYLINYIGLETITAHALTINKGSEGALTKSGFVNKYPKIYEDWGFGELQLTDKYVFKAEWMKGEPAAGKLPEVKVEQFVMAYEAEQDRIRAMLPDGYVSLRPVLRINTEIRDDSKLYVEFNTPVEADGRRGWLNIANWKSTRDDIRFERVRAHEQSGSDEDDEGAAETVIISAPFLELRYKGIGIEGGCPAEKDNEGTYYIGNDLEFRPAEKIEENKEFCDCSFRWRFCEGDASGVSQGKTLPAHYEEPAGEYEKCALCAENAAAIPCRQVLGAYIVRFTRKAGR